MECESCRTREAIREVSKTTEDCPEACGPAYRLCAECAERLENYALRPAEFFNLAAIHGHGYYLHDDFYDWENGRAEQPEIRMTDVRKFPFPSFKNVMTDPARLLDYAIVQGFPSERTIARLRQCNKQELLGIIRRKVAYNPELLEEVDDLVARVIGREAEEWVREVWQNRQPTETIESYALLLGSCLPPEEAFETVVRELESYDERQFLESLPSLCYLRNEKTLDWMEHYAADKIQTVSPSYGHLAALSHFDWARCLRWLRMGRPLSLIALDALYSCTLRDYAGQSPLLSELQPRMADLPTDPTEIEAVLRAYQEQDNVTRVRHTVDRILAALI